MKMTDENLRQEQHYQDVLDDIQLELSLDDERKEIDEEFDF